MKNLQNFKEFELSKNEAIKVKGGGLKEWLAGYIIDETIRVVKELNNYYINNVPLEDRARRLI